MEPMKDEGLAGNETIEQAILALQQDPVQEQLAHTLTVLRRQMHQHAQLVAAVEPDPAGGGMKPRVLRTADGACWWYAFTGFEEELKGAETVRSGFLVDMDKLFGAALKEPGICGVILNPWCRTLQLDKTLLRITKGQQTETQEVPR